MGRSDRCASGRTRAGARYRTQSLTDVSTCGLGQVLADRANDLRIIQKPCAFLLRRSIAHVWIVEDLREGTSSTVLADDVGDHPLLVLGAGEQERERIPEEVRERHNGDCILVAMRRRSTAARF